VGLAPVDIYCDAFVARGRHELDAQPVELSAPGIRGVAHIRLLVTDDSAYDRLVAEVDGPWRGVVMVFERAARCNELLRSRPGWTASHPETAMVLRDVGAARGGALPDGLELRPVNEDGVTVKEALTVAVASDTSIEAPIEDLIGYFGALPPSAHVFAAVDAKGVAHATSACHVFGEYAQIFFVNTEPEWRRRGIGTAMTRAAVEAAAGMGARMAMLHATTHGASLYEGIGFEPVDRVTRYSS
jgi:ribosomal protein S18 acetylase RimI-like enzyme